MLYNPRLTSPSDSDLNYKHYTMGGYNYCIKIRDNGSVLPNCVGYAWGRWRELLGAFHKLSRGNAENWYPNTGDGYQRGQVPKLGAVICWRKGQAGNPNDGAGHVAIVEKINGDGSITISNSAYSGTKFYLMTLKAPYNVGTNYFFQGFIYNPNEYTNEEVKPTPPSKSVEEVAREVIRGDWGNGQDRVNRLTNAGYDYNVIQAKVNEILNGSTPAPTPTPQPQVDILDLVRKTIRGDFGNGSARRNALGSNYDEVQRQVNLNLKNGTTQWGNIRLY